MFTLVSKFPLGRGKIGTEISLRLWPNNMWHQTYQNSWTFRMSSLNGGGIPKSNKMFPHPTQKTLTC